MKWYGYQFSLGQLFYKACSDHRYSHIADGVIENTFSLHMYVVATLFHNDTVNNVTLLRYDNVVTLS